MPSAAGSARSASAHAGPRRGRGQGLSHSAAVTAGAARRDDARLRRGKCVVLAIDAKRGEDSWEVHVAGGRTPSPPRRRRGRARHGDAGRGSPAHLDGSRRAPRSGWSTAWRTISEAVDVPVIASGKASTPPHQHLHKHRHTHKPSFSARRIFITSLRRYTNNQDLISARRHGHYTSPPLASTTTVYTHNSHSSASSYMPPL